MVVLQQMAVLFSIMIIGFLSYKKDIINDEVSKKLSSIVVNIANPALILSSVIGDNSGIEKTDLLLTLVVAIAMFSALMLLSIVIPIILRVDKKSYSAYRVMTVFSNIGFMGFPIISSLYGANYLLYASVFLLPYNLLIYTYGVQTIKQNKKKIKFKEQIKQIMNIGVMMSIFVIVVYLTKVKFPTWINASATILSNMTVPLSMMVIGSAMATMEFRKIITNIRLLIFSVIRLLIVPILGTFLVKQIVSNPIICDITIIMLSVPVGSMTSMLAQEYDGDYGLTSKGVTLTTILSVVTIPVVSYLVKYI